MVDVPRSREVTIAVTSTMFPYLTTAANTKPR